MSGLKELFETVLCRYIGARELERQICGALCIVNRNEDKGIHFVKEESIGTLGEILNLPVQSETLDNGHYFQSVKFLYFKGYKLYAYSGEEVGKYRTGMRKDDTGAIL